MVMKPTAKYGKKAEAALDMWVKLARAFSAMNARSNEDIRSYGLTGPQFGALECLGHLGSMTIGELSKKMLVSGGNTTCIIDNLEKEGLAERVHTADDRRVIMVQLTAKGKKRFNEIFPRHAAHISTLTATLTDEEQVTLGHLLKKLGRGVQNLA